MTNVSLNRSTSWVDANRSLPVAGKEVAIKGGDFLGDWEITGGVWWQPYKGQPHTQGRWIQRFGNDVPNRLPESDEVTHWRYV